MRRYADTNRVLATRHNIVNVSRARQDHRERARPKSFRQLVRGFRNLSNPTMHESGTVQMNNHWMVRRPPLRGKDLTNRCRVRRIGPESVDRFRGKCNELTVAQRLHGSLNLNLSSSDNSNHGAESYQQQVRG